MRWRFPEFRLPCRSGASTLIDPDIIIAQRCDCSISIAMEMFVPLLPRYKTIWYFLTASTMSGHLHRHMFRGRVNSTSSASIPPNISGLQNSWEQASLTKFCVALSLKSSVHPPRAYGRDMHLRLASDHLLQVCCGKMGDPTIPSTLKSPAITLQRKNLVNCIRKVHATSKGSVRELSL